MFYIFIEFREGRKSFRIPRELNAIKMFKKQLVMADGRWSLGQLVSWMMLGTMNGCVWLCVFVSEAFMDIWYCFEENSWIWQLFLLVHSDEPILHCYIALFHSIGCLGDDFYYPYSDTMVYMYMVELLILVVPLLII